MIPKKLEFNASNVRVSRLCLRSAMRRLTPWQPSKIQIARRLPGADESAVNGLGTHSSSSSRMRLGHRARQFKSRNCLLASDRGKALEKLVE